MAQFVQLAVGLCVHLITVSAAFQQALWLGILTLFLPGIATIGWAIYFFAKFGFATFHLVLLVALMVNVVCIFAITRPERSKDPTADLQLVSETLVRTIHGENSSTYYPTRQIEPTGRVLVVDDEKAIVETVQRILEERGYVTCGAYDGFEAIEVQKTFRPDIVVTGVVMPNIDGFSTALKILESSPQLKFVFMSGSADELRETFEHTSFHPTSPLISKPFTHEHLIAVVKRISS